MEWTTFNSETGKIHVIKIDLKNSKIIGTESTGHWRSETGGTISFKGLIAGDWDELIIKTQSEDILEQVKEKVKEITSQH